MFKLFIITLFVLSLLLRLEIFHGLPIHQLAVDTDVTRIKDQTKRTFLSDALWDNDQWRIDVELRINLLVLFKSKLQSSSSLLPNLLDGGSCAVQKSTD